LTGFTPDKDYQYLEVNQLLRRPRPEIVRQTEQMICTFGGVVQNDPATDLLTGLTVCASGRRMAEGDRKAVPAVDCRNEQRQGSRRIDGPNNSTGESNSRVFQPAAYCRVVWSAATCGDFWEKAIRQH